jgi:predicted phosphodiesterase
MSFSTELYHRCRNVLMKCSELDSDGSLRAVFVTSELKPFRDGLREASSKRARVDQFLSYMNDRKLSDGRPALLLFFEALYARYHPDDALRDEIEAIALMLGGKNITSPNSTPTPVPTFEPLSGSDAHKITWLHLSDFHFRTSQTYDSNIVLQALLEDVQARIEQDGLTPDFIAVTGDVAFSGKAEEYELASEFFDDLLTKTNLPKERLFLVPGNHDVDRDRVSTGVQAIGDTLTDRNSTNAVLVNPGDRRLLFDRFVSYANFVNEYLGDHLSFDDEHYYYTYHLRIRDHQIAILGLNSAWLCASDDDKANGLLLGERQVRDVLEQSKDADMRIALLHHPFDWLREFDQNDSAALLYDNCDFILQGHLHQTATTKLSSPDGEAMVLGCGACYETREFPNMHNWVRLDPSAGNGKVFLRRYSDARGGFWANDTLTYKNVVNGVYTFALDGGGIPSLASETSNPGLDLDNPPVAVVRDLLTAAFTPEELRRFCQDRPLFQPLINRFSPKDGLVDMVDEVIDYNRTRLLWKELLGEVARANPRQYNRFESRLCDTGS